MADTYYTLITALPHLPSLFKNKHLPITRIRLEERLRMLSEEDTKVLADIENIYAWNKPGIEDGRIVTETTAALARVPHPDLQTVIERRLALRTVVTALRYRLAGGTPGNAGRWGYRPWDRYIENHLQYPYFHMEHLMPWLPEVAELLNKGLSWELEKRLLAIEWEDHSRVAARHYFDFEAVALYVQRWHLIARWTGCAHTHAPALFEDLVAEAMVSSRPFLEHIS
ncbi:hypothetical protein SCOR_34340 [Sulfidibacter corallicola]|uniref:DUF2764 family protein n=1 Tax=Sulfidibacter corallicola TaxID=2818388 RepID=A0A8A4TID3_SULCO|nr:hypothetical protein [Sulfidibacter corallicola]QTD49383.1 hypothetical protein J3U87_27680 [Sulfidibacter corallicola]